MLIKCVEFYANHKVLNDTCSKVHNGFGAKARETLQKCENITETIDMVKETLEFYAQVNMSGDKAKKALKKLHT